VQQTISPRDALHELTRPKLTNYASIEYITILRLVERNEGKPVFQASPNAIYCEVCNYLVESNFKFCHHCGQRLIQAYEKSL
jgi:rRNA maturation endonuclease Nob1